MSPSPVMKPKTGTTLCGKGYGLAGLSTSELSALRGTLTARPFIPKGYGPVGAAPEFPVYHEEAGVIYVPKAFGLERYGVPEKDSAPLGEPMPDAVKFAGELRAEQRAPADAWLAAAHDPVRRGGVLNLPCAFGKCLAHGTPVLLADGSIRPVEDICIGNVLVGGDTGVPRTVIGVCIGKQDMVRVIPLDKFSDPYTVNGSHLLTVWDSLKGELVEVEARTLLAQQHVVRPGPDGVTRVAGKLGVRSAAIQELSGARVAGSDQAAADAARSAATAQSAVPVFASFAERAAAARAALEVLGATPAAPGAATGASHAVPFDGGAGVRGHNPQLSHSIALILRTLGQPARVTAGSVVYWSDDRARLHNIAVEAQPAALYYGFTLSTVEGVGNGRFLLGDCTVTHNTAIAINLMCAVKRRALVVVHKEFLVQQWRERLQQFAPAARIGLLQGDRTDVENKDVVIAMLQSLAMREYPASILSGFGTVVVDEIHRTGAEVFSRALRRINFRYSMGLSATLQRKDGMSKVFLWHIGDVVFRAERREDREAAGADAKAPRVRMLSFSDSNPSYSREHFLQSGKHNLSRMINNVCGYGPRTARIADEVAAVLANEPQRRVLMLSDRRAHLAALEDALRHRQHVDVGYYLGGMKQEALKASESRAIILGTFAMSAEGLDIRGLDTLVLASPKTDVVQAVGRVLRDKPSERRHAPLIIDLVDMFSPFEEQSKRRAKYYMQAGYKLEGDAAKAAKRAVKEQDGAAAPPGCCMFVRMGDEE